jgi:hypothetical protein
MPGIVDWRTSPLQIVDQIFQENKGNNSGVKWHETVDKFFLEKLKPENGWNKIPSLNSSPNHSFVDGQIVRFRGMIQVRFV